MKVKDLLSDESRWTQFCFARNENREECGPRDPEAVCWCLSGAIVKCYADKSNEMKEVKSKVVGELQRLYGRSMPTQYKDGYAFIQWNDEHRFEVVRTLAQRLDI